MSAIGFEIGEFESVQPYKFAPLLKPEDIIGERYEIEGTLGQGGHAKVYQAVDIVMDNPVAIKVPHNASKAHDEIVDQADLERFAREAEISRAFSLESDDVPQFVQSGIIKCASRSYPALVSELARGGTLADKIVANRGEAIELEDLLKIMIPACRALSVMHSANVVHRDFKPANILADGEGNGKLGDFGIVTTESFEPQVLERYHISPDKMSSALTKNGRVVGTEGMLAPESYRGYGRTKAADIYAVGVTLNQACSEVPTSEIAGQDSTSGEIPAVLIEVDMCIYDELHELVESCREIEPTSRPTIEEVVTSLEAV